MADKLLIRLFDVGLGDCIYCRIPKAHKSGRDFHMLIDCGALKSKHYGTEQTKAAPFPSVSLFFVCFISLFI